MLLEISLESVNIYLYICLVSNNQVTSVGTAVYTVLRNLELKPGAISPKIYDLYNKDIDMRWRERQLRVLPDLLNSCPDIASKVTRVYTLANMLAAGPLASSMFSEAKEPFLNSLVRQTI